MKTPQEILGTFGIRERTVNHVYSYLWKSVLQAMQLYSDQQNKDNEALVESLLKENEELRKGLMLNGLVPNSKDAEIQRLTKEVEELKQSKEQRIVELTSVGMGKQQEIDDAKLFIKNLQSRINELQRALGWSDMEPHHPIGSRLGYGEINKEPDWDKLSNIEPPTDNHLDNKAWRGAWLEGQMVGYAKGQLELTRLRELLGRSKDYIFLGYVGAVELCDAIDNELNPKP